MTSRRATWSAGIVVAALVAACGGTSAPSDGDAIAVAATEYRFEPAALAAAPGTVTFRVTNTGLEEHEFEILAGDAVVDEIEGLVPGLSKDLTVDLDAGQYAIVCRLADHEARGMVGTLTVAP
jgi:iron uptake system component EfeO